MSMNFQMKSGLMMTAVTLLITVIAFKLYAPLIYKDLDKFPDFAKK